MDTTTITAVPLSQHLEMNSRGHRSASQNPIMGVSSKELDNRNKMKTKTRKMAKLLALTDLCFSKAANRTKKQKRTSNCKQYQSEEFTADSSVDKYMSLDDDEQEEARKLRAPKKNKNKKKKVRDDSWKSLMDPTEEFTMSSSSPEEEYVVQLRGDDESCHTNNLDDTIKSYVSSISIDSKKVSTKIQSLVHRASEIRFPLPMPLVPRTSR